MAGISLVSWSAKLALCFEIMSHCVYRQFTSTSGLYDTLAMPKRKTAELCNVYLAE